MSLGFYSYLAAAIAYSFFAALLLFSWRQSLQGRLLFIAIAVSAAWSFLAVKVALNDEGYLIWYQAFEILRYIVWYVFLLMLFDVASQGNGYSRSFRRFSRKALVLSVGLASLFMLNELLARIYSLPGQFVLGITGNVLLALVGLALVEQLYRNTSARFRWATKYLFMGAGGIFAFDFYLYSDALLFRSIDQGLWDARGVVHLVAVPLLAISSARNRNWSLNIFVSRDVVLNTGTIFAGGFYLLAMAGAGYYIREFGGSWGKFGQVMFISLAVVFFFVLVSSAKLRAQIKVFLGKHFYKNKYDYRLEWLRLTEDLGENGNAKNHYRTAIEAIAHIIEARAGSLWLCNDKNQYRNVGVWHSAHRDNVLTADDSLIRYLSKSGFVINLHEIESHAEEYQHLLLPKWISEIEQPWLIVPLNSADKLLGFVVLANPLLLRAINWEDRDLLKAAAKQISSYLMVLMTSAQLAESKQFEVFTRLSAYMVHDLKNIAAELDLVALNAKKFSSNPEFVADAFDTVENAASDISRLLEQLRNKRVQDDKNVDVNLSQVIEQVISTKLLSLPKPHFSTDISSATVSLDKSRLSNVLAHLIDNAQQATDDKGEVCVTLFESSGFYQIEIKDSGHGMDDDFIRHRLFKAFDTTKGNAGMGIGMYESREYMRHLGGDISALSKPGKGSIITLQIPLYSSVDEGGGVETSA
ncbi:MAG: PEP-CTERM system histidine kinase PrsK [Gammaproteobacteria bacterium]|nr:PEP-CTERM system histidine kinase PrsK [Gammaproteobacteria bacterium]